MDLAPSTIAVQKVFSMSFVDCKCHMFRHYGEQSSIVSKPRPTSLTRIDPLLFFGSEVLLFVFLLELIGLWQGQMQASTSFITRPAPHPFLCIRHDPIPSESCAQKIIVSLFLLPVCKCTEVPSWQGWYLPEVCSVMSTI